MQLGHTPHRPSFTLHLLLLGAIYTANIISIMLTCISYYQLCAVLDLCNILVQYSTKLTTVNACQNDRYDVSTILGDHPPMTLDVVRT